MAFTSLKNIEYYCGLGSRIRDMEADMVNIFDLHGDC